VLLLQPSQSQDQLYQQLLLRMFNPSHHFNHSSVNQFNNIQMPRLKSLRSENLNSPHVGHIDHAIQSQKTVYRDSPTQTDNPRTNRFVRNSNVSNSNERQFYRAPIPVPNWKIFYTGGGGKNSTSLKHFLNQVEYEAETERISLDFVLMDIHHLLKDDAYRWFFPKRNQFYSWADFKTAIQEQSNKIWKIVNREITNIFPSFCRVLNFSLMNYKFL
jgi:hypothetical protein